MTVRTDAERMARMETQIEAVLSSLVDLRADVKKDIGKFQDSVDALKPKQPPWLGIASLLLVIFGMMGGMFVSMNAQFEALRIADAQSAMNRKQLQVDIDQIRAAPCVPAKFVLKGK